MIRRYMESRLRRSFAHFPAVLLTGARQVGKTTLLRALAADVWKARFVNLDDRTTLDAAIQDPDGFIRDLPRPAVIDEVQRAPDLLRAIKVVVDEARRPGQFVLSGSANVLTLARVSESLAGRVAVHELHPFAWAEQTGRPVTSALDDLFAAGRVQDLLRRWPGSVPDRRPEIREAILRGGYPTPALTSAPDVRRTWFESYRRTYLDRDIRDLATLERLPDFHRVLVTLATETGRVLNLAALSRTLALPYTTLRRYLNLLLQTYQVTLVAPWAAGARRRLAKAPKLYATDTGLAAHLAAADAWSALEARHLTGAWVETWVAAELQKLAAVSGQPPSLWTWRTAAGEEVDFILERGGQIVGIEVKWGSGVSSQDLRGLRRCREAFGNRWRLGVLLHGGTRAIAVDDRTAVLPFSLLLGRDPATG